MEDLGFTERRALRRLIVQMEINDLAAIAAVRARRKARRTLSADVEVALAAKRAGKQLRSILQH